MEWDKEEGIRYNRTKEMFHIVLIYPLPMWTLMAIRKMAMKPKKRREWTKMEMALVWKLQKSTALPLPGTWKSNPGESTTNRTNPITTPAQSPINISLKLFYLGDQNVWTHGGNGTRSIYLYCNVWRVFANKKQHKVQGREVRGIEVERWDKGIGIGIT